MQYLGFNRDTEARYCLDVARSRRLPPLIELRLEHHHVHVSAEYMHVFVNHSCPCAPEQGVARGDTIRV